MPEFPARMKNPSQTQLEAMQPHVEENRLEVVREYVDQQGTRAQFEEMLAEAAGENPQFRQVLVYDPGQLSHLLRDFQEYRAKLEENGITLTYIPCPVKNLPTGGSTQPARPRIGSPANWPWSWPSSKAEPRDKPTMHDALVRRQRKQGVLSMNSHPGPAPETPLRVQREGDEDVTIVLPVTTDCAADGRKFSTPLELTVSGPDG